MQVMNILWKFQHISRELGRLKNEANKIPFEM